MGEEELKEFAEGFGPVESAEGCSENMEIVFKTEEGAKKMLFVGRNRLFTNKFSFNNIILPTPSSLALSSFHFPAKMTDVVIDQFSLNSVVLTDEETTLQPVFACEDIYQTNYKMFARNTTKLPSIAMIEDILGFLFSPNITFFKDEKEISYQSYTVMGESAIYDMRFYFGNKDLDVVNYIRSMASKVVSGLKTRQQMAQIKAEIRSSVLKFLNKEKFRKITESGFRYLYEDLYKAEPGSTLELNKIAIKAYSREIKQDTKNSKVKQMRVNSGSSTLVKYAKYSDDFLPQISKEPLNNDYSENLSLCQPVLQKERALFSEMYPTLKEKFGFYKKLILNNKSRFLCGECEVTITGLESARIDTLGSLGRVLKVGGALSYTCCIIQAEESDSGEVIDKIKEAVGLPKSWIYCINQDHLIGFKLENQAYLTDLCKLKISNQMEEIKEITEISQIQFKSWTQEDSVAAAKRNQELKKMRCPLCNFAHKDPSVFLKHLEKNKEHLRCMQELWQLSSV